jgi:hypothetical protein
MSTIEEVLDSEIEPSQPLSEVVMDKLYRNNIAGLRELTYGTTQPAKVYAHNHADARGETLERSLLSLSFGPQAPEGSAATTWEVGLPMWQPISGSFATTPAMLAASGFLLPGGVSEIYGSLAVSLPGAGVRSVTLKVCIRAQEDAGFDCDSAGVTNTVTISIPALAIGFKVQTFTITADDLLELGAFERNRLLEVSVWLASDSPAASDYRLLSLELRAAPNTLNFQLEPNPQTTESFLQVQPADIRAGAYITAPLTSVLKRQEQQDTFAILGRIPGLFNLGVQDEGTSFRRTISQPHQHTGKFYYDGACLPYGGFTQNYLAFYGQAGTQMQVENGIGQFLYNVNRASYEGRVSCPQGLGAFVMQLAIQPTNTAAFATLQVDIKATTLASATNLAYNAVDQVNGLFADTGARAGYITMQLSPITTANFQAVPTPQPQYNDNPKLWTKRRLLADDLLPDGASVENAYRISSPILVQIANSTTQDLRVVVELTLTGETNGVATEDIGARLVWLLLYPAPGY